MNRRPIPNIAPRPAGVGRLVARTLVRVWPLVMLMTMAAAGPGAAQIKEENLAPTAVMEVPPPSADGTDTLAPAHQGGSDYEKDVKTRYLGSGLYKTVLAGRYLDEAPARNLAQNFQSRGLTAFVLKKRVTERRLLGSDPVGDFYLVLVGLFGRSDDADILGRRLKAEGQLRDYRILPVKAEAELEATETQTQGQSVHAAESNRETRERAAKPLPPDSPAASGEAFKKNVQGRFVGSFRDPWRAQAEAERLSGSGWSASVQKDPGGAQWYRVYLAPTQDHRDWKADEPTLKAAKRSAASQPGLVILADMSRLEGRVGSPTPNAERTDASACAGFSEAGRVGAVLTRTIVYIPDTSYTAALVPISPREQSLLDWREIPGRVQRWWNDEQTRPVKKAAYGPAIFNRPEMEKAVSKLTASPDQASLALGLTEVSRELSGIPGRKILLVFSEFQGPDRPEDVLAAMGRLKSEVSGLTPVFIYGDTDGPGYALASDLARESGSGQAWDACRLLADNAYFEQYIKAIFH